MSIDMERLARLVSAEVLDALNRADFGEQLARKVADLVVERIQLGKDSAQGWAQEYVHPAWSGLCIEGAHADCNGTAPPSEHGCDCPHHRGEPVPELGYRLVLVERTEADFRAEGGGR